MAHTLRKVNLGNTALATVTITSYTQGGESFTLAEFGLTGSLVSLIFIPTMGDGNPGQYCQYIGGGVVKLFSIARPDTELPTTASMNFTFVVIVQGT